MRLSALHQCNMSVPLLLRPGYWVGVGNEAHLYVGRFLQAGRQSGDRGAGAGLEVPQEIAGCLLAHMIRQHDKLLGEQPARSLRTVVSTDALACGSCAGFTVATCAAAEYRWS